jgi:hypothetical protein
MKTWRWKNDEVKNRRLFNRGEIRDAYDMSFIQKRHSGYCGIRLSAAAYGLTKSVKNFTVKLGALLESSRRKYYREHKFRILEMHLRSKLHVD